MAESWSFFLSNEEEEEKKNLVSILPCSYSLVLRSPPCWSSAACLSGSFSPQRTPSCRCTSPPFGQLRDSSTTFPFLFSLSRQTHAQTRRTTAERDINIRGFSYGYTYEYEFEILFFFFFFGIPLLLLDHTDYRWYYRYIWKFVCFTATIRIDTIDIRRVRARNFSRISFSFFFFFPTFVLRGYIWMIPPLLPPSSPHISARL